MNDAQIESAIDLIIDEGSELSVRLQNLKDYIYKNYKHRHKGEPVLFAPWPTHSDDQMDVVFSDGSWIKMLGRDDDSWYRRTLSGNRGARSGSLKGDKYRVLKDQNPITVPMTEGWPASENYSID